MYGLVSNVSLLSYDIKNIMSAGSLNWFNVAAYDPLHFLGDMTVSYQ